MKTRNITLIAALFAVPALSFADGGATEPFENIHSAATRSDVVSQAVAARSGNDGNIGLIEMADAQPKTRQQVLAELAEARRLGLVNGGEVSVVPTVEQQIAITQAGLRAVNGTPVAANASLAALLASPSVAQ